jgi:hypothetical protein
MIARNRWALLLMAIAVFLFCAPEALGMFWKRDLRKMVQEGDRVIKGKVLRGTDLYKPGPHVALLEVLDHFKLGREKRLEVFLENSTANPSDYSYREGEVCFLCLEKSGEKPGTYQEVNYGHTKIPVEDGQVSLGEVKVPDPLKFLLPDRKVETFENALRWIRGPEITMKAKAETSLCDGDILFDVTMKNVSRTSMKISVREGLALGCLFDISLLGKHGFFAACRISGGYNKDEQYFPNEERNCIVTELQPGKSIKGLIRFRIPLDRYFQDPTNTRFGKITYRLGDGGNVQPGQWTGEASVTVPLKITCPYQKWAQTLMIPNRTTSIRLDIPAVLSPDHTLGVMIDVNRSKAGKAHEGYTSYSFQEEGGKKVLAELARCFEISRKGKVIHKNGGDRETLKQFVETTWNVSFAIDLSKHFDFSKPGEYRLRFYLPGPDGFTVSQQVRMLVPEREK